MRELLIIFSKSLILNRYFEYKKVDYQKLSVKFSNHRRNIPLLSVSLFFSGSLASIIWIYHENISGITGSIGRATSTIVSYIFSFLVSLLLIRKYEKNRSHLLSTTWSLILVITIISSIFGIVASLVTGPIYARNAGIVGHGKSTFESPGAVSPNYFLAGKWVQKNTSPSVRFFTNRQCFDPNSRFENCLGTWFYASALTERQFLIEGATYNLIQRTNSLTMNEKQRISLRFSLDPSPTDLKYLWSNGVRWGWIDKHVVDPIDWRSLATIVYQNREITIIKLVDPSKIVGKL